MGNSRILLVNFDRLAQKSLYEMLCRSEYKVDIADSAKDAVASLDEEYYDIILTEVSGSGGVDFLRHLQEIGCPSNVIILTSYGNIETAVDSIKMGAFDYLVRPVEDKKIVSSIERALASQVLSGERLTHQLPSEEKTSLVRRLPKKDDTYYGLVGKSRPMSEIYSMIEQIANSKATVLLRGESGTGKRLVAHALHKADRKRRHKPFVEMSCGALPREIIESELFGHTKGAFTGAINDRKGRFELAHGGTILLDDIDSLALDLQVKLLRVLQHKEFERVGENRTIKVDIRIIVSTNQDLEKAVEEKRFREDLYYRLNVISINVPPLRERKEDLASLADHFIGTYARENLKRIQGVSDEVLSVLLSHNWPGNIRELENIIERAVILDTNGIIEKDDLPELLRSGDTHVSPELAGKAEENFSCLKHALQEPERGYILRVMDEVGWNKKKAARKLGVNRTTLYNKLRKYNIDANKKSA